MRFVLILLAIIPLAGLAVDLFFTQRQRDSEERVLSWTKVLVADAIESETRPQFTRPTIIPYDEPGLWSVTGKVLAGGAEDNDPTRYRVDVAQICDAVTEQRCWQLLRLKLGGETLVERELEEVRALATVSSKPLAQTALPEEPSDAASEASPDAQEAPVQAVAVATQGGAGAEPEVASELAEDNFGSEAPATLVGGKELVFQVQEWLIVLGYDQSASLRANGVFGPRTQVAVQAYQRDQGLTADGAVTAQLLASLEALAVTRSTPQSAAEKPSPEEPSPEKPSPEIPSTETPSVEAASPPPAAAAAPAVEYQVQSEPADDQFGSTAEDAAPDPATGAAAVELTPPDQSAALAPADRAPEPEHPAPAPSSSLAEVIEATPVETAPEHVDPEPDPVVARTDSETSPGTSQSTTSQGTTTQIATQSLAPQFEPASQPAMASIASAPTRTEAVVPQDGIALVSSDLPLRQQAAVPLDSASGALVSSQAPALIPTEATWAPSPESIVFLIQDRLIKLGYSDAAPFTRDGKLGPRTRVAISAYQQDQGLLEDGEASKELLEHIEARLRAPRPKASDSSAQSTQ